MGDVLPKFVAAAVQASPVFLDREATVEKACRLIREAGRAGARLAVFPEAYIPTFPYWPRAMPHPHRHLSIRAYVELYKNAVEIPSPSTDKLCRAAREADTVVVMGLNEREKGFGATMFNTLLYIDRTGEILGVHRKLVPTFEERCVWGQGDASDLRVFHSGAGRVGGLVCGNNKNALWQYALLAQGEEVHASVWPALEQMCNYMDGINRGYALMGQVFVIVSCGVITEDQVPDSFPLKGHTRWNAAGGSGIIGPDGNYLAGPVYGGDEIVYAELDFEKIIEAKAVSDSVGHYARWDVARLQIVGAERYRPVEWVERPPAAVSGVAPGLGDALPAAQEEDELVEAELRRAVRQFDNPS
ncbi:MAG: carbon-nitrogen hydrolase family protein [Nitrospinota bacterium]